MVLHRGSLAVLLWRPSIHHIDSTYRIKHRDAERKVPSVKYREKKAMGTTFNARAYDYLILLAQYQQGPIAFAIGA